MSCGSDACRVGVMYVVWESCMSCGSDACRVGVMHVVWE